MKKQSFLKSAAPLVGVMLLISLVFPAIQTGIIKAITPTTSFSDSFGTNKSNLVTGWIENEDNPRDTRIDTDNPRSGSTTGHVRLRLGASIIKTIDTVGYKNIQFSYYWRGDSQAEDSDFLRVQWRVGTSGSFTSLANHPLNNTTWIGPVTYPLGDAANNTTIIQIRFIGDSNHIQKEARIDDVVLMPTGSISSLKFNDLNGNGQKDQGEPGLAGWTINLNGAATTSVTTGIDGAYLFSNLPDGAYTICEDLQSTWIQTMPNSGQGCAGDTLGYSVTISDGNAITGQDFGNFKQATIIGYKWQDQDNDGIKKEGEPAIKGWQITLNRIVSSEVGTTTEMVATTTTDQNGQFTFIANLPGDYQLTEESRSNWKSVASSNSSFEVVVNSSGQTISKNKNGKALELGNVYYVEGLGGKFAPINGSFEGSTSTQTLGQTIINVPENNGTSTITIDNGTIISKVNGDNFTINQLIATSTDKGSLSGLGTRVVVDGALQWGIAEQELEFSQPITISIYVGESLNGQTLNVLRSTTGNTGWTNDGIVPPATCVVANGLCTFQTTKASFYAGTHTVAAPTSPVVGNTYGGGSSNSGSSETTTKQTVESLPNLLTTLTNLVGGGAQPTGGGEVETTGPTGAVEQLPTTTQAQTLLATPPPQTKQAPQPTLLANVLSTMSTKGGMTLWIILLILMVSHLLYRINRRRKQ